MSEHITHTAKQSSASSAAHDRCIAGVCRRPRPLLRPQPGLLPARLRRPDAARRRRAPHLPRRRPRHARRGQGELDRRGVLADRRDHPGRLVGLGLVAVAIVVLLSRATIWPTLGRRLDPRPVRRARHPLGEPGGRRAGRILIAPSSLAGVLVAAIVAAVVAAFSWFNVSLDDGVGKRTYTPAPPQRRQAVVRPRRRQPEARPRRAFRPATPVTHVQAHVGIGELRIDRPARTPRSPSTRHAKVGDLYVLNQHDDGRNAHVTTGTGGLLSSTPKSAPAGSTSSGPR